MHPPSVWPPTVFVYGTLMPGERNAHVAAQAGPFGAVPATLPGFRLVHLSPEGYPGIVRSCAQEQVHGHALTYAPDVWVRALPGLDALEGVDESPPLYTRELVQLTLPTGEVQAAWTYLYARPDRLRQAGVRELPTGDWREVSGRGERGPDER